MAKTLRSVDMVEILTLQDNHIDFLTQDNSAVIKRARLLNGAQMAGSILAEHGFSTLITLTHGREQRRLLFDFGFSEDGAIRNAETLNADLSTVDVMVLSHGHPDHTGGLEAMAAAVGRKGIELVVHPAAFKHPRFLKTQSGQKISFPIFSRDRVTAADITLAETKTPRPLIDNHALFLGQIPRKTDFELGSPGLIVEDNGEEKPDGMEDDSALVFNVSGRGLVILTGCAHAGIINTVNYAIDVTGINEVFAIMGGFHLSNADFSTVVEPTTNNLIDFSPRHIIPTHCTGRHATNYMENTMPAQFILNMAGTKLTFAT